MTTIAARPSAVVARLHLGAPGDFEQGTFAFQVAVGEGGVWAALDGSLVHVDPTGRVVARIRIGDSRDIVGSLVVGAGGIWA